MQTVQRGTKFRRPFVVPRSLDELTGPDSGTFTLPHSVYWASQKPLQIDTASDDALVMAYRETLGTADYEQLVSIINKKALIRLWPRLTGDRLIRRTWESRFPELLNKLD